jgi:hypothetical protein
MSAHPIAPRLRSRLTDIHFNTTLLTEMRGFALSRRVARRSTLDEDRFAA